MPYSGKGGSVRYRVDNNPLTPLIDSDFTLSIPDVRQWQYNDTSDNKAYTSSSTSGRVRRIAANGDFQNGSIDVYSADTASPLTVGSKYFLALGRKSGLTDYVAVIIDAINHLVNIETGDIVGYQIQFSGNGLAPMETGGGGGGT